MELLLLLLLLLSNIILLWLLIIESLLTIDPFLVKGFINDRFEEFFNEDKDVLFMVGTAHLIGENGIANQLKQRGYIVVQISK